MNAKQQSTLEGGQGVRELHPAPGALPAIIALTTDAGLIQAVEELGARSTGLALTANVAQFSERLMQNTSGIGLIDSAAVPTAITDFVDGIARQFPELVLVVAGGLSEQGQLAAQIGSGRVYRFVHMPVSAQRLRLFIEAAARHQVQLARPALPAAIAKPVPQVPRKAQASGKPVFTRPQMLIGAAAAAVLLALVLVLALRPGPPDAAPAAVVIAPAPDPRLEQAAATARARAELDQLLNSAETALTEVRLDEAERLAVAAQVLADAQQPGVENSRVRFLQTQIARERERAGDEEQRRSALGARQVRLATYLRLADERMQKGVLIEPARDSALFYVEAALDLAPGDSGTVQVRAALVKVMLAAADRSLGSNDVESARRLADAAAGLNAPKSELDRLRRRADELSRGAVAAAASEPVAVAARSSTPAAAVQVEAAPTAATIAPALPEAAPAPRRAPTVVPESSLTRVRSTEVQYPEGALVRGQTGYVDLEFTVATNGAVKDITVVDAQPRNVFERSATAALRGRRYAPVMLDGQAVEQRARLRVRFADK